MADKKTSKKHVSIAGVLLRLVGAGIIWSVVWIAINPDSNPAGWNPLAPLRVEEPVGELAVVTLFEALQIGVSSIHIGDVSKAQLLDQAILKRPVRAFYAALCLTAVCAQNLNVQRVQCTPKLGHTRTAFGVFLRHAEHRVFVAVERDRAAMCEQIAFQRFEIAERALRLHEPQFHERAGGVIDEDEQGTRTGPVLKPAMI